MKFHATVLTTAPTARFPLPKGGGPIEVMHLDFEPDLLAHRGFPLPKGGGPIEVFGRQAAPLWPAVTASFHYRKAVAPLKFHAFLTLPYFEVRRKRCSGRQPDVGSAGFHYRKAVAPLKGSVQSSVASFH